MTTSSADMDGKTVIVTGASGGIGGATARCLAAQGARLVLVARDRERARALAAAIESNRAGPTPRLVTADLSSLAGVQRAADDCLDWCRRVDVLVNNVGGIFAKRMLTVDGLERTVAVNHLCAFLLTHLLMPALRVAKGRVVNVSSEAHRLYRLDLDDMGSARAGMGPFGFGAYSRSKLMNVLFTYELARRESSSNVTATAVHPGLVATRFGHNNGRLMSAAITVARPLMRSPQRGAETVVFLASAPEVADVTGRYFVDRRIVRTSPQSYDQDLQVGLWERSAELVGTPP